MHMTQLRHPRGVFAYMDVGLKDNGSSIRNFEDDGYN